jgi:hypothetical protein
MQKKIEAMLGSQLLAIATLTEELEQARAKIAELEKQLKATSAAKPKGKKHGA